ncbi:Serine/arginine-rich splicing factor 1, partial [Trichinella sp. T8]
LKLGCCISISVVVILKMSSYHGRSDARIYVGNLPPDIRSRDIESCFERFGKVVAVDLKNRKGPPFAFVEFEDARDAEDAVRYKDGYELDGYKLRVEFPRGSGVHPGYNQRNRMLAGRNGCRTNASRHTGFRCYISGLPASGSWQDLKDHMREAGDVCFSDVYKNGNGVVEYMRAEDLEYALANLNESRFRSHEYTVNVNIKDEMQELLLKMNKVKFLTFTSVQWIQVKKIVEVAAAVGPAAIRHQIVRLLCAAVVPARTAAAAVIQIRQQQLPLTMKMEGVWFRAVGRVRPELPGRQTQTYITTETEIQYFKRHRI